MVKIVWIDSVRSLAYQAANDAARTIAKTIVLVVSGTSKWSVRLSVMSVPNDADHDDDRASRRPGT